MWKPRRACSASPWSRARSARASSSADGGRDVRGAAGLQLHLQQLEEERGALGLLHLGHVVAAAPRRRPGLRVRELAQEQPAGADARPRGERALAGERGVVGEVRGHRLRRLRPPQALGHAQVHEPPPRLREVGVDGPPDHLVGELVGAGRRAARRAEEGVTLEQLEREQQPAEVEGHQLAEPTDVEAVPEHGGPAQHVSRLGGQALHAVTDELGERTRQRPLAPRQDPRHLEGEQRVSPALREHRVRVHPGRRRAEELPRPLVPQGGERDLHEEPHLAQAAQRALRRLVVVELAGAGGEGHEQRAVTAHAGHVVEELRRGRVEPVHVVEGQHHGRGGGGALGQELDHRPEETVAARRRAVPPGELGQKGPEVGGQGGADRARRELAEGIDPRAERPVRLGLERPSAEHGAAAGTGGLAQLVEEARLAEARLAGQQQRPRAALAGASPRAPGRAVATRPRGRRDGRRRPRGEEPRARPHAATRPRPPPPCPATPPPAPPSPAGRAPSAGEGRPRTAARPRAGGRWPRGPARAARAPPRRAGRRRPASARGAAPPRDRRPGERRGRAGASRGACAPPRARPRTRPGSRGSRRGRAPRGAPRGTRSRAREAPRAARRRAPRRSAPSGRGRRSRRPVRRRPRCRAGRGSAGGRARPRSPGAGSGSTSGRPAGRRPRPRAGCRASRGGGAGRSGPGTPAGRASSWRGAARGASRPGRPPSPPGSEARGFPLPAPSPPGNHPVEGRRKLVGTGKF